MSEAVIEGLEEFREVVRDLARTEILPHIREWDEKAVLPRAIVERPGELGCMGILLPEKWGGGGLTYRHYIAILEELGAEQRFWKLRMRPGAPVGFGLLRGIPWIGLPGNPVSTMVTFELFVRPAVRAMSGHALPFRRAIAVRVAEPVTVKPKLQHFLRAIVSDSPSGPEARLTGPQGSGILTSMARANALLVIPEDRQAVAAESQVKVHISKLSHRADKTLSIGKRIALSLSAGVGGTLW